MPAPTNSDDVIDSCDVIARIRELEGELRDLEDVGDLPRGIPSYIVIDWAATADNLKVDYTEVDFDGVTYLVR